MKKPTPTEYYHFSRYSGLLQPLPWLVVAGYFVVIVFSWSSATSSMFVDTARYVDAALNLAETGKLTLVRYQLYFPQMLETWQPRLLTEQPPLYPILIAFLLKLGVTDGLTAAYLVSAVAFVIFPLVFWAICKETFGSSPLLMVTCFLLTCSLSVIYRYAISPMSDSLAVTLLAGGFYLTLRFAKKIQNEQSVFLFYTFSAIFLSLSVYARFPNGFVLPGLFLGILILAYSRDRLILGLSWVFITAVIAGLPILARFLLSTDISLPNAGPIAGPLSNIKSLVVIPFFDIFLGGVGIRSVSQHWYILALFYATLLIILAKITWSRLHTAPLVYASQEFIKPPPATLSVFAIFSYAVLLVMSTSTQTLEPINSRYLLPIYPFLLLFLFEVTRNAFSGQHVKTSNTLLLVAVMGAISLNAWSSIRHHESLNSSGMYDYSDLKIWVRDNVSDEDIILTTDARLGYWLNRPAWYLPMNVFHGRTFTLEDNLRCARASKKVWLVITANSRTGIAKGDWGSHLSELQQKQRGVLYRLEQSTGDADIYLLTEQ